MLDPDLFLHFEITPHRTVLFYIGVFGATAAAARGMIPEDNQVFDPEALMMEVIHYTHYMPMEWKGQLHSQKVCGIGRHGSLSLMEYIHANRFMPTSANCSK